MTEASFKAAKQEASSGEPFRRGRLQYFFPCPMTAIYECRKAAVRELGGTLTEGPVRKKSLKSCHLKDMGGALMSPNFIVFRAIDQCQHSDVGGVMYPSGEPESCGSELSPPIVRVPVFSGPDFEDVFKLQAKLLNCSQRV